MADTTTAYLPAIANPDSLEFVSFDYPKAKGEPGTSTFGEISIVRDTSYNGNLLVVAFWRVEPAVSPLYDIPLGDESGYVIRGSATIELLDTGETLELAAGDLYTFRKNTLTRWTIHEPFLKFVVVNDGPAAMGEPA
ncbi:cupin domain-containing protein [Gulosibacter faecalis]|uniref:Cupin domain-containing protein n=1 Tax=Gulosibacter faecalis TaxID=272240 RepID=A0ABW5UZE3_9MICO|nr:cupin domain-containing protein [Gulosibacter faecalis]